MNNNNNNKVTCEYYNKMESITFTEINTKFPALKELIDYSLAVSDKAWQEMMVNINNKGYKYIATSLNKIRVKIKKDNNSHIYNLQKIKSLAYAIGIANTQITRGDTKHQDFLDLLGIPHHPTLISIKNGRGITTKLSCYPHTPNRVRINRRDSDVTIISEILCEDKSDFKIALSTLFKVGLKAINNINNNFDLEKLRQIFFGLNPENTGYWIILHKDSRMHRCCIPAINFVDMLNNAIEKRSTKLYNYIIHYDKKIYNTPELLIVCPACEMKGIKNPQTIMLNYIKLSYLLKQFGTDKYNEIMNKYTDTRNALAIGSNMYNIYNCNTHDCKYKEKPRIIILGKSCLHNNGVLKNKSCLEIYQQQGYGNFHKFKCTCSVEICAICLQPEQDHLGETKVCPQTEKLSHDEIQAMLEKGFKQCPCCKVFTEHIEGCDHMTCAICRNHWCFRCCELLPIDPVTNSRYVHRCNAPVIEGHYQAYVLPGEMPAGVGNMHAERNPAEYHYCF